MPAFSSTLTFFVPAPATKNENIWKYWYKKEEIERGRGGIKTMKRWKWRKANITSGRVAADLARVARLHIALPHVSRKKSNLIAILWWTKEGKQERMKGEKGPGRRSRGWGERLGGRSWRPARWWFELDRHSRSIRRGDCWIATRTCELSKSEWDKRNDAKTGRVTGNGSNRITTRREPEI